MGTLPGLWIGDKHFKSKISKTGLKCVSSMPMSTPTVLKTLLGNHGEPLAQPVHGVDGAGVVVDAALALPAVPVLAQPIKIEVEGTWRLQHCIYSAAP